jgi:hypothetical protein
VQAILGGVIADPQLAIVSAGFFRSLRGHQMSGEAITLMKRTLLVLALLIGVPAMAQVPPEIAKTLTIVSVQRDDSFGCQNLETYLAIASSFAEV